MRLDVSVKFRDFTDPVAFPRVLLTPDWYTWNAVGGPDTARISATGAPNAMWSLLNWLRAPVEIIDEQDEAVWWGYIAGVTLQYGTVEVGVTLDQMRNRIAVTYVEPTMGGVATSRETTDWVQNDESVAAYGTKELLDSRAAASAGVANARAAALLEQYQYPLPTIRSRAGTRGRLQATVHARGWWHTLDWRYFSRLAGLVTYETGAATQQVGSAAGNQQAAQSFQIEGSEGWYASKVAVRLRKEGTRTDDVNLHLCADNGGVVGGILTTATVPAADVTENIAWVEAEFGTEQYLSPATAYWIVISPTGAVDAENYYVTVVDEGLGYESGVFRLWDGVSWYARDPDADMPFRISGVEETTAQVKYIIENAAQFLVGVEIVDASGTNSLQFRGGDNTALYEVKELLADGTASGQRLLATVTRDRYLRVYREPERPSPEETLLFMDEFGAPQDKWGNKLLAHRCPVAQWCTLTSEAPAVVNPNILASPVPFFVESAEYRVDKDLWTPTARGVPTVWDVGRLIRG